MLLHETNARELGFYLGALFVNEIDESLNPSSQSDRGSIRQGAEAYADFFSVKESIRALRGRDAVNILQSGFGLYHQCAMQIRVEHGETATDYFKVAFLATFYVRGRNAGMPLPVTTQVQSQIRDAAQRICSSDRTERFLAEGSAEALFACMNQLGVLQGSKSGAPNGSTETTSWQVFISHASEDKEDVARPLACGLQERGDRVWFDELTLRVGDSLRRSIDRGLSGSRYGVVVISPRFLHKEWPQRELDGLVALETEGRKVILPVWHDVDERIVRQYSPILADRVAASTRNGLTRVVEQLIDAMS